MTLQRATIEWPPDTFYFLSPDGEDWLEVDDASFHLATVNEEQAVEQLTETLKGGRLRFARRWLAMQNYQEGRTVTFL